MKFYDILKSYKENLCNLNELSLERDTTSKELHYISFPYRRIEIPNEVKEKTTELQDSIYKLDDEIGLMMDKINIQKREMKSLSEDNRD